MATDIMPATTRETASRNQLITNERRPHLENHLGESMGVSRSQPNLTPAEVIKSGVSRTFGRVNACTDAEYTRPSPGASGVAAPLKQPPPSASQPSLPSKPSKASKPGGGLAALRSGASPFAAGMSTRHMADKSSAEMSMAGKIVADKPRLKGASKVRETSLGAGLRPGGNSETE